jgi:hypothetical protein
MFNFWSQFNEFVSAVIRGQKLTGIKEKVSHFIMPLGQIILFVIVG